MVIKEYLNETDKLKQSNAIIPNIIHSLDASHLMNVINNNFDQNFDPIITVHDCFGTHPNNMEQLVYRVKKEFILLYSQQNFLKTFHNRIIQSIRDNNFEIRFNKELNQLEIPELNVLE
jgi:DNA-directed RNA polymerase